MSFLEGVFQKQEKNTISVFTYVIENSSKNIFLEKKLKMFLQVHDLEGQSFGSKVKHI